MTIRRTEASFEGGRGLSLFRRAWIGESPERLIVLVHGFAEHSGRYESVGAWLAERGSAVHALDLRGHGRSGGRRNHVDRFEDFLEDLERFVALARSEHPALPCTIIGHSMGGLIVCAFARERRPEVLAVVTSGAALAPGGSRSKVKESLAGILRRVVPKLSLDAGLPVEGLSRDAEVLARYLDDPLIDSRITVSLGAEMLQAAQRTAGGGGAVEVPMLLLHGGDDPLCAASGSEVFFSSLPDAVRAHSAVRIYPGLLHEIFNEPEHLAIFEEVLSWIRAREQDCAGTAESPSAAGALAS